MEKIKKNIINKEPLCKISRRKELIKPTKPHKHSGYHEIIVLSEGAGVHTIDDNDYEVNPPTLFYLQPDQVHCWDFTQIPKGFVLIFKDEFLDEFSETRPLLSKVPITIRLKNGIHQLVKEFDHLFQEFSNEKTNELILKAYLNIIIYRIIDLVQIGHKELSNENVVVNKFKLLVDKYYKVHKELSFYANHLNVTNRKLSGLCKLELGRPSSSIISERLVKESKRLLRYTSNSISEIAFELEFTDSSHFVKFFKSKTKLTPLEFRKRF